MNCPAVTWPVSSWLWRVVPWWIDCVKLVRPVGQSKLAVVSWPRTCVLHLIFPGLLPLPGLACSHKCVSLQNKCYSLVFFSIVYLFFLYWNINLSFPVSCQHCFSLAAYNTTFNYIILSWHFINFCNCCCQYFRVYLTAHSDLFHDATL